MSNDQEKNSKYNTDKMALSVHGDFFQQFCLNKVRESGWQILAEEYPISSTLTYGSLDIWAASAISGDGVNLLIECKKSHPKYKRWIFMSKPAGTRLCFPTIKMRKSSLKDSDPKIDPYKKRQLEKTFDSDPAIEPNIRTDIFDTNENDLKWLGIDTFAYGAHEIKIDASNDVIIKSYEKANRTRERPPHERIYHGCHQLSLATKSIMIEELRLMEKQTYVSIPMPKIFISILVTNAELVSCEFDPEEVDPSTGEPLNEDAVRFTQVKRLAYHFPLPEEFYLYPQDVTGDLHVKYLKSASQMGAFKKLFIIVVSSLDLRKFLDDLKYLKAIQI
ncbi:MAG: hypothetical protein NWE90_07860 [Candidatus Bathyarchaeota archaeon]|nr:hypothetical protein [Candidatus Bathyarchaeota archaeon]